MMFEKLVGRTVAEDRETGGEPPSSIVFEKRLSLTVRDLQLVLMIVSLYLLSTVARLIEDGLDPESTPATFDIVFVVAIVGVVAWFLTDFLRKRRHPQPILLRILEEGLVSPQWRQAASDSITFRDLVGVAWENEETICFETANGSFNYTVSMPPGLFSAAERRFVRWQLSERIPFFSSRFKMSDGQGSKRPHLLETLMWIVIVASAAFHFYLIWSLF